MEIPSIHKQEMEQLFILFQMHQLILQNLLFTEHQANLHLIGRLALTMEELQLLATKFLMLKNQGLFPF